MALTEFMNSSRETPLTRSADGDDKGRVGEMRGSPSPATVSFSKARVLSLPRIFASCRSVFLTTICGVLLLAQLLEDRAHVELGVPDVQVLHLGERAHGFAVGTHHLQHHRAPVLVGESPRACGHLEADRQTLHVPFPRPGQGLVEVVHVEHERALRGGEDPEVHQVRVSAGLHAQPGTGGGGEVGRHHVGGAAIEGKGRDHHAPVADGDQFRHPGLGLLFQQSDGVHAIGRGGSTRRGFRGGPGSGPLCPWRPARRR